MPLKKKPKKVEPEEDNDFQEEEEEDDQEEDVSFEEEDDDDEEYDPTQEEEELKGRGKGKKAGRKRGRRRGSSDEEEEEEFEDDDDVEYRPNRKVKGRPKRGRTRSGEFDDSRARKTTTVSRRGRKRKNMPLEEEEEEEEEEEVKEEVKKAPKKASPPPPPPPPVLKKSQSQTDWSSIDLSSDAKTADGKPWTHKFSSWNVNGVRAWLKNDALQYVHEECPDIFCIQETKCSESDLPKSELEIPGYHTYWNSADKKGYSGTGLYCKEEPIKVTYGIGSEKHDNEGRVITAEFEKFYFVTAYVPNAGDKLKRLDYRVGEWDPDFKEYLGNLDKTKPVVICGDLNVAHHEIDLANPKTNQKTAGFTKEERESFTTLLEETKFIDSFRSLYPDKKDAYSYWSYRFNARANNKGWRLDYFLISEHLKANLCDSLIRSQVCGSDHCPIVLLLAL